MIIDLREPDLTDLPNGTEVITSKGFHWNYGDNCWKDLTSGLVWLSTLDGMYNHFQATELQNKSRRLPTKEEFKEAEKHGIREIIDMEGKFFWSSSVYPNGSGGAYYFSGGNGDIIVSGTRSSSGGSVRFVAP